MDSDFTSVKEKAIEGMKEYFGSERFIDHTLKVLGHAERIFSGEKVEGEFPRAVVALASIYHDIGIPESVRKFDSMDAPYQEREGPAVARELMSRIEVRGDILERVCYIVGAHHTKEKVDGIDFQIIWEADFLVNLEEKNLVFTENEISEAVDRNIETHTGKKLVTDLVGKLFPGIDFKAGEN